MATNYHNHNSHQQRTIRAPKACFSFAAYAKTVITSLKKSDVHVAPGLTNNEISNVESAGGFTFPPDLRSILYEGVPVGPGFPNWRSSSHHQLRLLTSLPILSLIQEVSRNNFWVPSWGPYPNNKEEAHYVAKQFLRCAPPLVPVFRHCYIPTEPNLAGNPVFYVHGGDVRLLSVDVGGFFKETEFWRKGWVWTRSTRDKNAIPAWAQRTRRITLWTEAIERERTCRRWWTGELGGCIEEVMWRLREGGWAEEDVREMMMMNDCNEDVRPNWEVVGMGVEIEGVRNHEGVVRHVRKLSRELLKGGWSIDDVIYSFSNCGEIESGILDGEAWVEFRSRSLNLMELRDECASSSI
ncbi:hypothetical protein BVRB_2g040740 [Beta vulgaris subsp. vulgaris]|nr:hypothetical protein BVRB_2g040740 [Beta vulgaris subsp. vulgaris]